MAAANLRGRIASVLALLAAALFFRAVSGQFVLHQCQRVPKDTTAPRSPGSNGYGIYISSNPQKYVPQMQYTVTLRGQRATHDQIFTGFMLVVERSDPPNDLITVPDVGNFQLLNRDLTKFSADCPHAITHTSNLHKNEINVSWTAPAPGSGCVVFRATVIERKDVWRMDDGPLTRVLCEEEQSPSDQLPEVLDECGACDEAKYEITFEGLWSRYTHPKDFPQNEWLTHFSDLVGASHTADFRIFEYGGMASQGVRMVAQQGSSKELEKYLKKQANKIRTIIKARGLWYPKVTGKTFAWFRVDRQHHLMSVLSMLGPSPDWFVGVSGLELCLPNGSWTGEHSVDLYPLDAGANSLNTYLGQSIPTIPQEPIKQITSTNMPGSPFFDPTGAPMKPLARLTVTRLRLYEKACDELSTEEPPFPGTDYSPMDYRPECEVTEWSAFSPCSVTCGEGVRMRTRSYVQERKARAMGCATQLVEKELCSVTCVGGVSCETTPWSRWSECSATCGKGHRARTRKYLGLLARKVCDLELTEREMCEVATPCPASPEPPVAPGCEVTPWSEWSPCMATCGKGRRVRTRLYLSLTAAERCSVELLQEGVCMADKADCDIDISEAKEICRQPKEGGPCRGYFPRWYFDTAKGVCLQFIYGGCRGNRNNFERYSDCFKMCQVPLGSAGKPGMGGGSGGGGGGGGGGAIGENTSPPPIPCMVTPWTEWSPCSRTCGKARKTRTRMIKQNALYGGRPCPKRLTQRRKCKDNPPCPGAVIHVKRAVDCELGPWGEWMPCTRTCGPGAVQQRSREIRRPPRHGGAPCGPKWERKYCDLPPCPFPPPPDSASRPR